MKSTDLTFDDVKKSFEKMERIVEQNKRNSMLIENAQKLSRDENGFIVMTEEQAKQFYPDAMSVEDFFNQLENHGENNR